jgi:hypothetical protein
MNERIQKLIEQATTTEYGVDNGFDRVTFDKEKFAELIVKMCAYAADMAYDARCEYVGDYVGEYMGYGVEEGIATWRMS